MNDAVHARERTRKEFGIANIADEKLGIVPDVEPGGLTTMDLLDETIEDPNAIAALKGLFDHLAADKPGAAGDKDGLTHGVARRDL
jgi:hypothetical protein